MVFHLILISAQVQSKAGVPVLEGVTFGVFSRLQSGAASVIRAITGTWDNYVGLRDAQVENDILRKQVAELESATAGAARACGPGSPTSIDTGPPREHDPADARCGNDRGQPESRTLDRDGESRQRRWRSGRHGCDRSERADRTGHWSRGVARGTRAAAHRSDRGGRRRSPSALGQGGSWLVLAAARSTHRFAWSSYRTWRRSSRGTSSLRRGSMGSIRKASSIGTVEKSERGGRLHSTIAVRPAVDFSSLEQVLIVLVPARGAITEESPAPREGAK